MIVNVVNNLKFCGLYKDAKRNVTVYDNKFDSKNQLSRVQCCFVDSYPQFFTDIPNKKDIRQRIFDFCKSISEVTSHVSLINHVKYGAGDDFNYDDSDADFGLNATECSKLLKEDEISLLEKNIEKNLKAKKLIPKETKLKISFASPEHPQKITHYGIGYKLTFTNPGTKKRNNLLLKIFHINSRQNPTHGAVPEILNNIFINHNFPKKKNFQHFYFGNTDSFMVTNFITPDNKFDGLIYPEKLLGIILTDHTFIQNKIGDTYIDSGGIQKCNQLAYNTVARGIAKKIYRTPKADRVKLWNKLFEGNIGNKESVITGLTYVVEYLPKRIQDKYYKKIIKSEYSKYPKVIIALEDVLGKNYTKLK